MLFYTIHRSFPNRKEEPKGNCAKINVLQRVFVLLKFLKVFLKGITAI